MTSKKKKDIKRWMLKEVQLDLHEYLDSSNCFNCTKLAENANEQLEDDPKEIIPEEYFELSSGIRIFIARGTDQ